MAADAVAAQQAPRDSRDGEAGRGQGLDDGVCTHAGHI